jgi:hypothetical protein
MLCSVAAGTSSCCSNLIHHVGSWKTIWGIIIYMPWLSHLCSDSFLHSADDMNAMHDYRMFMIQKDLTMQHVV